MRRRLLWASLLVIVAVGYLAYTGWQGAALYYLTPAEAREKVLSGRTFRVAGNVGPDVAWDPGARVLRFQVTDGKVAVPVLYRGAPPDNFGPGQQVVVEGAGDGQGGLVASRLIMKCPSKYEQAPATAPPAGRNVLYLGGVVVALAVGLAVVATRRLGTGHHAAGRAGKPA
ncbi:MAG: cytochrome c maturation protein CcmE [Bacillota bacterium]|nr:cytochrome c maturation protein CcmE [Bacillota bacterium]MDI7250648.1 cytochrome c maturation protein CcmE [Bacillota bacterium]